MGEAQAVQGVEFLKESADIFFLQDLISLNPKHDATFNEAKTSILEAVSKTTLARPKTREDYMELLRRLRTIPLYRTERRFLLELFLKCWIYYSMAKRYYRVAHHRSAPSILHYPVNVTLLTCVPNLRIYDAAAFIKTLPEHALWDCLRYCPSLIDILRWAQIELDDIPEAIDMFEVHLQVSNPHDKPSGGFPAIEFPDAARLTNLYRLEGRQYKEIKVLAWYWDRLCHFFEPGRESPYLDMELRANYVLAWAPRMAKAHEKFGRDEGALAVLAVPLDIIPRTLGVHSKLLNHLFRIVCARADRLLFSGQPADAARYVQRFITERTGNIKDDKYKRFLAKVLTIYRLAAMDFKRAMLYLRAQTEEEPESWDSPCTVYRSRNRELDIEFQAFLAALRKSSLADQDSLVLLADTYTHFRNTKLGLILRWLEISWVMEPGDQKESVCANLARQICDVDFPERWGIMK